MPNKIKYNAGVDANALNIGNWSVGLDLGMGPTSTTGFKNGLNIPENGYAIYQHSDTKARIAHDDGELIYIINKLGANVGTKEDALLWSINNGVLIINDDFDQIVTEGLRVYLDPSKVSSYPGTGNTIYDLSGGNNFNVSSPEVIRDGKIITKSNVDYTLSGASNFNLDGDSTVEVLFKPTKVPSGQVPVITDNWGPEYGIWYNSNQRIQYAAYGSFQNEETSAPIGEWVMATLTVDPGVRNSGDQTPFSAYINGKHVVSTYYTTGNGMNDQPLTLGYDYRGGSRDFAAQLDGEIASVKLYNRRLTHSEILQNYHGGKIVTDELVYAIDAANKVSYDIDNPGVVRSLVDGTLNTVSGITYKNINGGVFDAAGSGDSIIGPNNVDWFSNRSFAVEGWVKPMEGVDQQVWFGATGTSPQVYPDNIQKNLHLRIYTSNASARMGFYGNDLNTGSGKVNINEWNHIICTYNIDDDRSRIFINGKLEAEGNHGGFIDDGANVVSGAWAAGGAQNLDGDMGPLRVYTKDLSQEEVTQNFNAFAAKFI